MRWLSGRKIGEVQERMRAGEKHIHRLNCGHDVGFVGFAFHLLLRPKPTDSDVPCASDGDWNGKSLMHPLLVPFVVRNNAKTKRTACLGTGAGKCVTAQEADTCSCQDLCAQESFFLSFLYLVSQVLSSACPHW